MLLVSDSRGSQFYRLSQGCDKHISAGSGIYGGLGESVNRRLVLKIGLLVPNRMPFEGLGLLNAAETRSGNVLLARSAHSQLVEPETQSRAPSAPLGNAPIRERCLHERPCLSPTLSRSYSIMWVSKNGHLCIYLREESGLKIRTAFTKFEFQLTSISATWRPLKTRPTSWALTLID